MKILKKVLVLIGALGLFFYVKAGITVRINKINCIVHDRKTIFNESCTVKPISRTTTSVNVNGFIIRNLSTLLINAQLLKKSEISFRPFLVNVTVDYCEYFINKGAGGAYMKIIAPMIMPYTNMNHTCPYTGYLFLKDWPIDADKLPNFWPPGNYRCDLLALEKNYRRLCTIQVFFEIKEIRNKIF